MPLKDPEARREYQRLYRERRHNELAAYKRAWQRKRYATDEQYREAVKAATRAVPSHVWAARQAVRTAIKRGELIRPATCEQCGRSGLQIEAAHYDYDQPLNVRWLCRRCHRTWDAAEPKGRKP